MPTRRSTALLLGLCAWTLFTWVTRVPLLLGDEALDAGEKALQVLPVLVFVVLAGGAALGLLRRAPWRARAGAALAAWSVAYWAVRLPLILLNDHPGGFKVVHSVLALVAGSLGAAALAALTRDGALPRLGRRTPARP